MNRDVVNYAASSKFSLFYITSLLSDGLLEGGKKEKKRIVAIAELKIGFRDVKTIQYSGPAMQAWLNCRKIIKKQFAEWTCSYTIIVYIALYITFIILSSLLKYNN